MKLHLEAREMALWLRALTALAEDRSSYPAPHRTEYPNDLFRSLWALIHMYIHA